jgi:hypothetical protein
MVNTAMTASGDALVLQCTDNSNFKPHPTGIWQAVCLDVIDLGLVWTEFQGKRKLVRKLKLVFETEHIGEDSKRGMVTKNFTASLDPKAKLTAFLGQWRGRQLVPGDNVDLKKLPGACCTLVLSHQQSMAGRNYVSIDAVSKATKRVAPSGQYDPAAMRQRIAEWAAKDVAAAQVAAPPANVPAPTAALPQPMPTAPAPVPSKSVAAPAAPSASPTGVDDFDPEVGF